MRKSLKFLEKTIVTPVQIVVVVVVVVVVFYVFAFFFTGFFFLEKSQKCDSDLAKEASP